MIKADSVYGENMAKVGEFAVRLPLGQGLGSQVAKRTQVEIS